MFGYLSTREAERVGDSLVIEHQVIRNIVPYAATKEKKLLQPRDECDRLAACPKS